MATMSSTCGGKGPAGPNGVGKSAGPKLHSDNLQSKYASAADDSGESQRKREAAMLFSVAEGHLNEEDPDEGLLAAESAVTIFREVADYKGLADGLRLVMHATRMKAANARGDGDADEEEKLLEQIEATMKAEHMRFIELRDKRGQAAMLLAIAEANNSLGGSVRRRDALEYLLEAEELLEEVQDKKLKALVIHEKSAVLHKKHMYKEVQQAAKEAIALFREIGDLKNEGFAWYALSAGQINNGHLEDGVRSKTRALKLWCEIGDKRLQGNTLNSIAEWHITERDDFKAGLAAAEQALALFIELGEPAGEAVARGWVIEAHIKYKNINKACQIAEEGFEAAKQQGDKKDLFWALQHLVTTHCAANNIDQALKAASDAVVLCKSMVDRRWECNALSLVASVHQSSNNFELAKQAMLDSVDLSKDLRGFEDEAFSHMQSLARILIQLDEYNDSLKVMEQARKLAQKRGEVYLEALAMLGICGAHAMVGDTSKAENAAELSRELYREEGYPRGEARVLKILSEIYWTAGEYPAAVRAAQEGVALMAKFGDNRYHATMKHVLATVHQGNNRPSEAAKAAMEGLKLARGEDDKRTVIKMIFMVLETNNAVLQDASTEEQSSRTFRKGCEKMLRLAKEAVGISLKIRDTSSEAAANYWMAHLYIMLGKNKEAMEVAHAAIVLCKDIKDKSLELRSLVVISYAHMAFWEKNEAVNVLNDAMKIAIEIDDQESQAQVKTLLEQITGTQQSAPEMTPQLEPEKQDVGSSSTGRVDIYRPPDPIVMKQHILRMVKNMTGKAEDVDGDSPLMESGIDSLSSVELRAQLQQEFHLNLPSTVMFNYPTVSSMTQLLVEECTNKQISWGR